MLGIWSLILTYGGCYSPSFFYHSYLFFFFFHISASKFIDGPKMLSRLEPNPLRTNSDRRGPVVNFCYFRVIDCSNAFRLEPFNTHASLLWARNRGSMIRIIVPRRCSCSLQGVPRWPKSLDTESGNYSLETGIQSCLAGSPTHDITEEEYMYSYVRIGCSV